MIGRTGVQALKALLELAQDPTLWRSVSDLAAAQSLPAPRLEQLLLRLRRAGVLEARRGRQGG
ncbi:MAG: Rrf2 family transcriptional regulator, partial [Cyanobacteriota bacterium]